MDLDKLYREILRMKNKILMEEPCPLYEPEWEDVTNSKKDWDKALSKIEISTNNDSLKEIFYTALYHTMIAPNLVRDVNGDYRATDMHAHNDSLANYTVFSLWDTFRSTHPLYNLIERKKTALFLNTFLNQY